MLMPSIFGENLFDDWMNFSFPDIDNALYGKHEKNMMKTDVKDMENHYEIAVDLPGFKKEDLSLQLNNGYLTIQAAKAFDKDEKDKEGRYNFIDTGRFIMSKEFIENKAISIDKSFDEDKAFEIYSKVRMQPNKNKNKERTR